MIPVYIWSPEEEGDWPPGAASRWWLHQSLRALDESLRERGSRLILARGRATSDALRTRRQTGATAVYWNRRYEPAALECATRSRASAGAGGIETRRFNSALLVEPHDILNQSGKPYRVYTPYLRRLLRDIRTAAAPLRAPHEAQRTEDVADESRRSIPCGLMPKIRWYATMAADLAARRSRRHKRFCDAS